MENKQAYTELRQLAYRLTDDNLDRVGRLLAEEKMRRRLLRAGRIQRIQEVAWEARRREARFWACQPALASLFLNIAHAIACRSVLRASKGHRPFGGTAPNHGASWTAQEGAATIYKFPPESNPLLWNARSNILRGLKKMAGMQ